jgi:hypothetical protein
MIHFCGPCVPSYRGAKNRDKKYRTIILVESIVESIVEMAIEVLIPSQLGNEDRARWGELAGAGGIKGAKP